MPRPPLIDFPDAVYHVTSRGNGRADIFHSNEDRQSTGPRSGSSNAGAAACRMKTSYGICANAVSDEPMPDVEGLAELIVYPKCTSQEDKPAISIFDLFGKADHLRSAEDIDAQIREEREAWGDR